MSNFNPSDGSSNSRDQVAYKFAVKMQCLLNPRASERQGHFP